MSVEQNEMNPSLEAAVYSLKETMKTMVLMEAEAERLAMQRMALAKRMERAVAALLYRLKDVPNPPLGDFPELNHKGE